LGVGEILYDYFDANLGSAAGHNRLLALDTAPFVLFINPDTFASPFMLIELAQPHWDTSVGIAEARQIPLEHPKKFDHATGDTSWASTAGCLVRREVTEKLNGFDADSFFLYCDDVDFSWRTRLAGYRVLMQPTACLFHDKRLTAGGQIGVSEAEMYYSAEASLMLAWKYSRPDLARKWSEGLLQSENPTWVRAADRFEQRRAEGSLPRPIDADGRVAQFVGMQFAEHRFSYSD
jgi:GT2 family glycosyltransferase